MEKKMDINKIKNRQAAIMRVSFLGAREDWRRAESQILTLKGQFYQNQVGLRRFPRPF